MLNQADKNQLNSLGISEELFEKQLSSFQNGIAPIRLLKACSLQDGISTYDKQKEEELIKKYERFKDSLDVLKFVPASGAATRMFKSLFAGLHELEKGQELNSQALSFIENLKELPFYEELDSIVAENGDDLNRLISEQKYLEILEYVLDKSGLNYGELPKALISFHHENGEVKTALEEHFIEAVDYATTYGTGRIHFTLSPEHTQRIKDLCQELENKYSSEVKLELEFSQQYEHTNTVAVYENNEPVRLKDGSLMFRPGGHGALLENLNNIRAQLIFIKNIDNVSASKFHEPNAYYKKLLAGRLLEMRENIHSLLNGLIHESGRKKASDIIYERWGKRVSTEAEIKEVLDRPIRVCGMVKNTGAPGGGPFWVQEPDGSRTMQILESSQIDFSQADQKEIFESSTHFNPVDIVCWVENHAGESFDLMRYRDDNTGFISKKSFEGKDIKALELPGLWNGSMAGWITEFVEVPLYTFNPVKTVLDLLNEGHRG